MLKTIAVLSALILSASAAQAGERKLPPQHDRSNPCIEGFQWYPEKRECIRKISREESEAKATPAKCKPGEVRKIKRDGRTITQRCGFMS